MTATAEETESRPDVNLLGVAGSLREGSHGTQGLLWLLRQAEMSGATTRMLDLRTADLPLFRPGRPVDESTASGAAIASAAAQVRWADVIVLVTPDYHGSMSGALKNFLDYHFTDFAGKLFGYICTSHDRGLTAMDQMRTAVRQCYGWSLPYGVSFAGDAAFDRDGIPIHSVAERLRMTSRDLVVYGSLLRAQFRQDLASGEPATFAARYRG